MISSVVRVRVLQLARRVPAAQAARFSSACPPFLNGVSPEEEALPFVPDRISALCHFPRTLLHGGFSPLRRDCGQVRRLGESRKGMFQNQRLRKKNPSNAVGSWNRRLARKPGQPPCLLGKMSDSGEQGVVRLGFFFF